MKMQQAFKPVVLVAMLATLLLPAQSVGAVSYEWIYGDVYTSQYEYYPRAREIEDASYPGWEVAFEKSAGPFGTHLGGWDCWAQGYLLGAGNPPHQQLDGIWEPVAYPLSSGTTFCIATHSNGGSGTFNGTLTWD